MSNEKVEFPQAVLQAVLEREAILEPFITPLERIIKIIKQDIRTRLETTTSYPIIIKSDNNYFIFKDGDIEIKIIKEEFENNWELISSEFHTENYLLHYEIKWEEKNCYQLKMKYIPNNNKNTTIDDKCCIIS